jgi:hypothetical protein
MAMFTLHRLLQSLLLRLLTAIFFELFECNTLMLRWRECCPGVPHSLSFLHLAFSINLRAKVFLSADFFLFAQALNSEAFLKGVVSDSFALPTCFILVWLLSLSRGFNIHLPIHRHPKERETLSLFAPLQRDFFQWRRKLPFAQNPPRSWRSSQIFCLVMSVSDLIPSVISTELFNFYFSDCTSSVSIT